MKRIYQILLALIAVSIAGQGLSNFVTAHPIATMVGGAGIIAALKFGYPFTYFHGLSKNAVQVEIWENYISGNLFKENPFLNSCKRADEYVVMGKVVHIPQAGSEPNVVKNRTVLPATVGKRTDTDVTYNLEPYTTDPILIDNADKYELSYDKMDNLLSEHKMKLAERVGDDLLITWAPTATGSILRTTGGNVSAHLPNGTGTRKAFTADDLSAAQSLLNKQKVPKQDRYCIMSEDMYAQLKASLSATQYRDFSEVLDAADGVIAKLHGFRIMTRTDVAAYNVGATAVNAYGATYLATDNDAVLCWYKHSVEAAIGSVEFFEREKDPTFYGDVYSAELRAGGRRVRNDQKGIVAIVQQA